MENNEKKDLKDKVNKALEWMGLKKPEAKPQEENKDFDKKKHEALELMGIKKGGHSNVWRRI